jgi:hypothetical protein
MKRKMKRKSEKQQSKEHMEIWGYTVGDCERKVPYSFISQDLYGFIDLCGLKAGVTGLLAVQATDKSNVSHRVRKIQASEIAKLWLLCGNQIQVHGWKDGSLRCLELELAGKEIVAMPL